MGSGRIVEARSGDSYEFLALLVAVVLAVPEFQGIGQRLKVFAGFCRISGTPLRAASFFHDTPDR